MTKKENRKEKMSDFRKRKIRTETKDGKCGREKLEMALEMAFELI